jgi:hypothetical protein
LFFAANFAIMGLYALGAYYALKLIVNKKEK